MKKLKIYLLSSCVAAALAGIMFSSPLLQAQVPALPGPPYNTELGAVITNSARTPGTVTTNKLTNLANVGIECTFDQTAASGTPSTTFSIQFYDSASNTYQSMVTSGAITSSNTPTTIWVGKGEQTASLPSGMVSVGLPLPLYFRVSQTITGANTTSTGTIGCNTLK